MIMNIYDSPEEAALNHPKTQAIIDAQAKEEWEIAQAMIQIEADEEAEEDIDNDDAYHNMKY